MISGGLEFVWASYVVAIGALVALAFVVALRLRHWAARARDLEKGEAS